MRELKFRAWLKEKKKMVSVRQINLSNEYIDYTYNGDINRDSFMNIELMQYTGLKDKNNKEIYEGDVIKYTTGFKGYESTYSINYNIVVYDNGHFSPLYNSDIIEIEVIGNIYENPEWLEV